MFKTRASLIVLTFTEVLEVSKKSEQRPCWAGDIPGLAGMETDVTTSSTPVPVVCTLCG